MSKRLFQLLPLIEIENFQTIQLRGKITIQKISEKQVEFLHEEFIIQIEAKELQIQVLKDELVALKLNQLEKMTIEKWQES
ncbi:hypothetical protein MHH85_04185 [Viridibacillus sp. FSL E2-0187]|uniref:hypothetical protein n=1 Tax=Viridibacillus TaxID=496496 RepID=UPI0030F6EC8B